MTTATIRHSSYFYPRSPRGERRSSRSEMVPSSLLFLSTLPARGATLGLRLLFGHELISIHAPREGSDICRCCAASWFPISIHAPREGSDFKRDYSNTTTINISIHAPREGSDGNDWVQWAAQSDFYPRSPRGERQPYSAALPIQLAFLSTLPARGATNSLRFSLKAFIFLSTLPARGATCYMDIYYFFCPFLSTLPARGATLGHDDERQNRKFLSTLPARGATANVLKNKRLSSAAFV